jgi:hypothetical protein
MGQRGKVVQPLFILIVREAKGEPSSFAKISNFFTNMTDATETPPLKKFAVLLRNDP